MKMLVNRVALSVAQPFDLSELKGHLRVAGSEEDPAITAIGEAAAAEVEQFSQLALLTQTVRVTIFEPEPTSGMRLPIGPVVDAASASVTFDGDPFTGFELVSGNRAYIHFQIAFAELKPSRLAIEYQAGFGPTASDIPRDLTHAVMDQAALLYDGRSPMDAKSLTTSPHMARIGARYRGVQL